MHDWLSALEALRREGVPAVLVTVASVKGSVPRGPGTKMVITGDVLFGTIGGGHLEYVAIDAARRMLESGDGSSALHRFPLGASLGQCCGGLVNLLLERVLPDTAWRDALVQFAERHDAFAAMTLVETTTPGAAARSGEAPEPGDTSEAVEPADAASNGKLLVAARRGGTLADSECIAGTLGYPSLDAAAVRVALRVLADDDSAQLIGVTLGERRYRILVDPICRPAFDVVLFGAGHVARALVNVLAGLPCAVTWIDSRDDSFPAVLPGNVRSIVTDAPEAEVDAARPGAYFLVMTHSHAIDETLTERILRRTDFAYFGLIGSISKRRQFERRIAARGMDEARFAAMTCPIGLPGVAGKEPGIIAVAAAAEILQRRARLAAAADGAAPARMRERELHRAIHEGGAMKGRDD